MIVVDNDDIGVGIGVVVGGGSDVVGICAGSTVVDWLDLKLELFISAPSNMFISSSTASKKSNYSIWIIIVMV